MQSFIHNGLFPSSLKDVIDKLLGEGVLTEREPPKVEKEQACFCFGLYSKKKTLIEVDSNLIHKDFLE
jgi:hypothetical protein